MSPLVEAIVDYALAELMIWVPAEVVAWYPPGVYDGAQRPARVDVRPQINYRRAMANAEDLQPGETLCQGTAGTGAEAVGSYPLIPGVPVLCPGARDFRLRGPVAVGEIGALHVSGRELLRWRQGEVGVTPPWMGGRLSGEFSSLTSSYFVPGLEVGPSESASFDALTHRLRTADGSKALELVPTTGAWTLHTPTTIDLGGGGAALPLAYQAQTKAVLQALQAVHTATVAFWNGYVPVTPDGIALKTFYTSTLTPTLGVIVSTLAAMVGTFKTSAE